MISGTPTTLQISAENFSPGDVARSESGELSKEGHRPSSIMNIVHVMCKPSLLIFTFVTLTYHYSWPHAKAEERKEIEFCIYRGRAQDN